MREDRSAIFWSLRISARVSASYTVTDQNSLIGGFGGAVAHPGSGYSRSISQTSPPKITELDLGNLGIAHRSTSYGRDQSGLRTC